jgi:hypothetical protein
MPDTRPPLLSWQNLSHAPDRDTQFWVGCGGSSNGENSPYGMIGGIEETSASFEARSAPRSYPTIYPFHMRREGVAASLLVWGLSCKTTFNKELWTSSFPLYSIKPNLRNLFMKKLTRDRVVPIISASVS